MQEIDILKKKLGRSLFGKLLDALDDLNNEDFPLEFNEAEIIQVKTAVMLHVKLTLKTMLESSLISFNPAILNSIRSQYEAIKDIDAPDIFYEMHVLRNPLGLKFSLYKDSVVLFSGPSNYLDMSAGVSDLKKRSFGQQIPGNYFKSKQILGFGVAAENFTSLVNNTVGNVCDASWTALGREVVKRREEVLDQAARTIQKVWRRNTPRE